ncbi:glycosyltransferase family 2 protein [Paracoccus tegillarcae]|uniref:Glycosyltransferase n=1 Tax=Paracoccus tegillarcae TaxID=1529068 RepID=A0A2K9EP48_9RHOB|nr:glycosyltransferase family 2 protein [Paracoccus tegillarcae]AUH35257.1 glycosyltransferase [Paracoccus tegillarcae]
MLSLIIPVYKNEANIPSLLEAISLLRTQIKDDFEAVFVVDGSPDRSHLVLENALPDMCFKTQLILLSRNFGSFAAIRAGLEAANGDFLTVMAADLQEPPDLVVQMYKALKNDECDVVYGERLSREDPWSSRLMSRTFWRMYQRVAIPEIPQGGVDIFGCTRKVRDQIMRLGERNSSLIGLLFWVGFRRKGIPYNRSKREIGSSAWTFVKKWKYMQDSVFSFSDLPISLLIGVGAFGLIFTTILSIVVLVTAVFGQLDVPGYAATMMVILFLGMLQILSMGVLGIYLWRVFENTKGRPLHVVMSAHSFDGQDK